MKTKKSGQIVMETNVKILIVVIVVALVLAAIFFFGDKFSLIYDNFIPKNNVPDFGDEVISVEERVSYDYNIPQPGANEKTVSLSRAGLQKILRENTLLEVRRKGKTIVKSNFSSYEDANPLSEKVILVFEDIFSSSSGVLVEFSYDSLNKKVVGDYYSFNKDGREGDINNIDCKGSSLFTSETKIIGKLNDEERESLGKIVCSSNGILYFVSNIIQTVKDPLGTYDCGLKIGNYIHKTVPGENKDKKSETIFNILVSGRPNYLASWGEKGFFSKDKFSERYSCLNESTGEFLNCKERRYFDGYEYKRNFSVGDSLNYQVSRGDEVFYIIEDEIWRLVYPMSGNVDSVINYCYSSLIRGKSCK